MTVLVYIAGPCSKGDVAVNVRNAMEAWHELHRHGMVPFCPHLSHFLHLHSPRPYKEWLEYDLHWLRLCDAVLRLPGDSSGADKEVEVAIWLKKPIFTSTSGLVEWAKGGGD